MTSKFKKFQFHKFPPIVSYNLSPLPSPHKKWKIIQIFSIFAKHNLCKIENKIPSFPILAENFYSSPLSIQKNEKTKIVQLVFWFLAKIISEKLKEKFSRNL